MQISQKKVILLGFLFLGGISAFSQNKIKQKVIVKDSHHYILSCGREYLTSNVITVKYVDLTILEQNYKVIRHNVLHYADIIALQNVSINCFITLLEQDNNIISVDLNSEGTYDSIEPNDSYLDSLWYLSEIHAIDAWEYTMGDPTVKVGILDSGTDWMHPDLGMGSDTYENIYCNPHENDWLDVNNPNSGNDVDDDMNGFIDDFKGWNFDTNTNDSRGTYFHGTCVAGIIGAKANNNYGIAGIAGGRGAQGVSIIPYCIGLSNPNSEVIDDAIIAAVDNGVNIIQFSLTVMDHSAIIDAIQYAVDNGVVVVCASGNNSNPFLPFPASNPNVIAVGATTRTHQKASFSNYGPNLSIVAPGEDIKGLSLTSLDDKFCIASGTSFAAPQVSAVIGLMLSVNPYLTTTDIRYIIESTAQKLAGYTFTYDSVLHPNGTWNSEVGYGMVDAHAAVLAAKTIHIQNKIYVQGVQTREIFQDIFAGHSVTEVIPYGNVVVKPYSDVTYIATNSIHLMPGFRAEKNGRFHAYVTPFELDNISTEITLRRNQSYSSEIESDHSLEYNGLQELSTNISIIPNPVVDICKVLYSKEIVSIAIYTIDGQCILQTDNVDIDASSILSGVYIVRVTTSDGQQLQSKMIHV